MMFSRMANLSNRAVMLILVGVALMSSIVSGMINAASNVQSTPSWWVNLLQNFSTEMFGAFLTFVLLQIIVGNRQEKERLIRQLRSRVNEEAIRAAEELRAHGWLDDGSLRGMNLDGASLQEVNLRGAHLQWVELRFAQLQTANLRYSNLQGVGLEKANLQNANLKGADLRQANLRMADLQQASLEGADLQGAYLGKANLTGANLEGSNLKGVTLESELYGKPDFGENTVLPDGSRWTPDSEIARFTDSSHPDFWRSDDPKSPAYHGNKED